MSVERSRRRFIFLIGCAGIAAAGAYWYWNEIQQKKRREEDEDEAANRSTGGAWVRVDHAETLGAGQAGSSASQLLDEMLSPAAFLFPLKVRGFFWGTRT